MIRRNWQELIKPDKLQVSIGSDAKRTATVVAEPLERGFGLLHAQVIVLRINLGDHLSAADD